MVSLNERTLLQQARSAIADNDMATARDLLYQVIKGNPSSEVAWLWLSAIVDDQDRERECLEQVLKINPTNELAIKHLQKLGLEVTPSTSASASPEGKALAASAVRAVQYSIPKSAPYKLVRYCPRCGAPDHTGNAFCPKCGLQLPDPQETCLRCGAKRPPLGALGFGFSRLHRRCPQCEKEANQAKHTFAEILLRECRGGVMRQDGWGKLEIFCAQARIPLAEALQSVGFRALFLEAFEDGQVEGQKWELLRQFCHKAELDWTPALRSAKVNALVLVERWVASAEAKGSMQPATKQAIHALQVQFGFVTQETQRITQRVERIELVGNIRAGRIPAVGTSAMLRAGEVCHWEASATPDRVIITDDLVCSMTRQLAP